MARTIVVANQKGGVGKTTTAVNLAAGLAAAEKRVLLLDVDAQANATSAVGIPSQLCEKYNLYRALAGDLSADEVVQSTALPHLKVIPGHSDLIGIEVELMQAEGRHHLLKDFLQDLQSKFDFILIDCPPSLGLLTINAMTAADSLLIPLQSEYFAMEGLSHLMRTIGLIQQNYNRHLEIEGILLTLHDNRNRLAKEVDSEVRQHFGSTVYDAVIPRNVRLSEAPSFGKPIILYDIQCKGAQAYLQLTKEFLERQQARVTAPQSAAARPMEQ